MKRGMKCDLKRDTRRGVDDGCINAGQDDGNNPKKPLTERWRHAWCHSSRKRFSGLNTSWHQVAPLWCHHASGGTTKSDVQTTRWCPGGTIPFILPYRPSSLLNVYWRPSTGKESACFPSSLKRLIAVASLDSRMPSALNCPFTYPVRPNFILRILRTKVLFP